MWGEGGDHLLTAMTSTATFTTSICARHRHYLSLEKLRSPPHPRPASKGGSGATGGVGSRQSGRQAGRQSGSQAVRQSGSQAVRQSGSQAVMQSGSQAVRQSGSQAVRQSGSQAVRQSGSQAVRQAVRQAVEARDGVGRGRGEQLIAHLPCRALV